MGQLAGDIFLLWNVFWIPRRITPRNDGLGMVSLAYSSIPHAGDPSRQGGQNILALHFQLIDSNLDK